MIVLAGRVVGRGWTQPGGRPHAEAMALAQAGEAAQGASAYVTLEPCAHGSPRGPACADLLIAAGIAEVVIALGDPDPRTDGKGAERLRAAGIAATEGVAEAEARAAMAGFLTRLRLGRPHVTLKLATLARRTHSAPRRREPLDHRPGGARRTRISNAAGMRRYWWGGGPTRRIRRGSTCGCPGLEARSPRRLLLTRHPRESGDDEWGAITTPTDIDGLEGVDHLLVEGGAKTASAFLRADLVDRLLLYRAPILIGAGREALGDIGLGGLAEAHGRWRIADPTAAWQRPARSLRARQDLKCSPE